LDGEPGVYSARWAGPRKDFREAMQKLHERLRDAGARDMTAHFVCALAIAWPDGHAETFEGRITGQLVWPPRGKLGFGYDPMFVPEGHSITFGEMRPAQKHAMSHRARAFAKFVEACLG
jgi:XTP/dITP diphosphohydrolase